MVNIFMLGENIKKYRNMMKLSQAQLADKLFVSSQAVSNWERGMTPPDLDNLCNLSALFGVSVDELLMLTPASRERTMIGIDGGGTKTEFSLFTESGEVLKTLRLSTCHPDSVGIDGCYEILFSGVDKLLELAPNVSAIFCGLAGVATKNNKRIDMITEAFQKRYKNIKIGIGSDILNVIYSGTHEKNVLALICGTGSILVLRKDGENYRFGGWGNIFDDTGSGYALGRDAVKAAIDEIDGTAAPTLITKYLKEMSDDGTIEFIIGKSYRTEKSYVASFAPVVFRAYNDGDARAKEILEHNTQGIANLINSAMRRHGRVSDIIACGGVFNNREIYEPMIQKHLDTKLNFIYPTLPPVYGACVGSCLLTDVDVNDEFKIKFEKTYKTISAQG